jgi:hypothetical protein
LEGLGFQLYIHSLQEKGDFLSLTHIYMANNESSDRELFGPISSEKPKKELQPGVKEAIERDEITEEVENALLDPETAGQVVTLASTGTRVKLFTALRNRLMGQAA